MVAKKTLLITNNHRAYTGGGAYIMMMLNILKKYYDIYTDNDLPWYLNVTTPLALNVNEISLVGPGQEFDLHLLADYRGWVTPRSQNAIQIIYYPLEKNVQGWNKFFVLNEFCQHRAKELYSVSSYIISPYYHAKDFYILPKKRQVINVGQYFYEQDDHSKNQHMVIAWFQQQNYYTSLVLHGKIINHSYYMALQDLCKNDSRIKLKSDRPFAEIKNDFDESEIMLHAIGYGRQDPAQTEHFGLVALEALLSGCQPFVHNSGGCRYIDGVVVYDEFDQVGLPTDTPENLRHRASIYKYDNTEQQILKAINE